MLTEHPATKQETLRDCIVFGQPLREVIELIVPGACCHLGQLQHREAAAQGTGVAQSMFHTDPVQALEETFFGWRGREEVRLLAVVDNRVFPQEWQRQTMSLLDTTILL